MQSIQTIHSLIQQGEGYYTEFKEALGKDISEELVAFSNASGGRVLLGVTDDGRITGFSCDNQTRSRIRDIANKCDPPVKVDIESIDNIIVLRVEEGEKKPYNAWLTKDWKRWTYSTGKF